MGIKNLSGLGESCCSEGEQTEQTYAYEPVAKVLVSKAQGILERAGEKGPTIGRIVNGDRKVICS